MATIRSAKRGRTAVSAIAALTAALIAAFFVWVCRGTGCLFSTPAAFRSSSAAENKYPVPLQENKYPVPRQVPRQTPNRATFFPFVWRKREGTAKTTVVPGILSTHKPDEGKPTRLRLLGGLIAKDCDYEQGKHRFRFLWIIPLGRWEDSKAGR